MHDGHDQQEINLDCVENPERENACEATTNIFMRIEVYHTTNVALEFDNQNPVPYLMFKRANLGVDYRMIRIMKGTLNCEDYFY